MISAALSKLVDYPAGVAATTIRVGVETLNEMRQAGLVDCRKTANGLMLYSITPSGRKTLTQMIGWPPPDLTM
jgi:hypothetical protein